MRCYLGIFRRGKKRAVLRKLVKMDSVVRVTDHGQHIKVISRDPIESWRDCRLVLVKDKTTHWDVRYWDFAMDVARRVHEKRQDPLRALGVMVHYLSNVLMLPELETLNVIAAKRMYINADMTDEEAHGWELGHVEKLRKATGWPRASR